MTTRRLIRRPAFCLSTRPPGSPELATHSGNVDGLPTHRTHHPKLDEGRARSALVDSLRLQIQAVELDHQQRERARQDRQLRFTRRLLIALRLVVVVAVVLVYGPLTEG